MCIRFGSGGSTTLSVIDGCRWYGDDGNSLSQHSSDPLVNIAHNPKFNVCGWQRPCARSIAAVGDGHSGRLVSDAGAHRPETANRYCGSRLISGLSYKTAFNNELLTSIFPL